MLPKVNCLASYVRPDGLRPSQTRARVAGTLKELPECCKLFLLSTATAGSAPDCTGVGLAASKQIEMGLWTAVWQDGEPFAQGEVR